MITDWEYRKETHKAQREHDREIGQRIKGLAVKWGISNKQMAKIMGYTNEKSVSAVYNGNQHLPDYKLPNVAHALGGIRVEYLTGSDGWESEYDKLSFLQSYDTALMDGCLAYLRSMGYLITPIVKSDIGLLFLCDNWSELIPLIDKECISSINNNIEEEIRKEKAGYSFTDSASLPYWFKKKHKDKTVTITWKKCALTEYIYEEFNSIGKTAMHGEIKEGANLKMLNGSIISIDLVLRVQIKRMNNGRISKTETWELTPGDLINMVSVIDKTVCSQANALMDSYTNKN